MVGWHVNGHEFEQIPGSRKDREPGVLQSVESQSQARLSD